VTLPLILARESDPSLSGAVRCAEEAAAVCDRIAATGALDEARERALAHVAAAKSTLDELDLSDQRGERAPPGGGRRGRALRLAAKAA
jgi:geranylgeranyl pyrophosphate synthase